MEQALQIRDEVFFDNDTQFRNAEIIKWAIVAGIFLFFFTWFVGGYFHARRRIRKGRPPLLYHRFLVPQHMRPPRKNSGLQNQFSFYRMQNDGYNLEPMPPPMYDPTQPPPPSYQPPEGASKVHPIQGVGVPSAGPALSPSQLEQQTQLQPRPVTARSPQKPWLSKILPKRNK